jgi:peptide-methionine (R)-S-oxide reductase
MKRILDWTVAPWVANLAAAPAGGAVEGRGDRVELDDAEWARRLSPEQYKVLRHEGTEPAFSSALNNEKRRGMFRCAGCGQALFASEAKFDSGTGWPSFFQALPGTVQAKRDFRLIWPRTEYHCARCGSHQGHVFDDGPAPSGKRFCNNGVALNFEPTEKG